jgi:hypothetical protein
MDLRGKTLWQVGAGDTDRSYGDVCIRLDVMLAGPGKPGPYEASRYSHLGGIRDSIRRLCTEARRGDVVLLRIGTGEVLAVGEVADDAAQWLEAFADIDGWDLHHVRRVRWFPNTARTFPSQTLGARVRTFAAMAVPSVRAWVESLKIPPGLAGRPLAALPKCGNPLNLAQLGERLFVEGLPSQYVDKLVATFSSLQRVAAWYDNKEKRPEGRPSESETVCYLVVPLLLSLGWSEQTAAVEWMHVDVALFDSMPPTDSTLACVVEAKLLGRSVFSPLGQAREYALRSGRPRCKRLIVTDGIRYAIHRRAGEDFVFHSYLNLLDMRDSYPVFSCGGAVEAVRSMAWGVDSENMANAKAAGHS